MGNNCIGVGVKMGWPGKEGPSEFSAIRRCYSLQDLWEEALSNVVR